MRTRLATAGLVLALAATLIHWPGFGYDQVRRPIVLIGAALALAAAAGGGGGWLIRMSDLALLALAVSAAFAVSRTDAVAALFPAVVAWIFLRAVVLGWIPRPFVERRGLQIVSLVGLLFSAYGLAQSLGADFLGFGRDKLAVSTLGNTNYAGVLSAIFAIVGLAAAWFGGGLTRGIGAAAALLGALHVAVSGSFGGLLGIAAGAIAFAALLMRRHGWKPAALIPLAILIAAVAPVAGRVAGRIGAIARGEDRTGRVRLGLWKGAGKLAAAHPVIGCGTGNFRIAFPPYRDAEERRISHEGVEVSYVEAEDPHNSYLAVLSESGPIALLAILAALGLALTAGVRRARDPDSGAAGLAIAGTAGLATMAVSGLFNSLSGHLPFAVLAALLAGGTSAAQTAAVPSRPTRIAWVVGALILSVAPWVWFTADAHYRDAMHTSSPEDRLIHAQRAVSALPGHWLARFEIAMCWRALGAGEGSAMAELRNVLASHPNHVWAMLELASGSPPEEEEKLLRRAGELAPDSVVVQSRLAGVDLRRRDYAAARRRLEGILKSLPDEPEALYTIGRTWLWERKPEEALPWLRRAIAKNPKFRERLGDDHPELKQDPRFAGLLGP